MSYLLLSDGGADPGDGVSELHVIDDAVSVRFVNEEGTMQTTRTMRQGNRLPTLRAIAFSESQRTDLTQFESITMRMVSGATEIEGSCSGNANGEIEYEWADGDTDTLGSYAVVFTGVDADGREQTIPTRENLTIEVIASP